MSIQFGRWNFDDRPVDHVYLEKVKSTISPYGPDGGSSQVTKDTCALYYAFHTTVESQRETQPHILPSGWVLTWDGRLDNRSELLNCLTEVPTSDSTDLDIVSAAFERWGTGCFAMLIGDWALSIWHAGSRKLILARDFVGVRPLYYMLEKDSVTWSTALDPLVLHNSTHLKLSEEYVAGWLSFNPAPHLTPYAGIYSVPPCTFVTVSPENHSVKQYWDFDPTKRISYPNDLEYEEHFRSIFRDAVSRRLRSNKPIIAELSGGMDSSSVVCVADDIIDSELAETTVLHTVSHYDDSEPNWDERAYFTLVEAKRGRVGCHIDVAGRERFNFKSDSSHFEATPGCTAGRLARLPLLGSFIRSQCSRVVLSGLGGDEVMGGIPTPIPELQDLLVQLKFRQLVRQLKVWALIQRVPWFHLFSEAIREFLPSILGGVPKSKQPVPWLTPEFAGRNREAILGYECRLSVFRSLPSFQANIAALEYLRRKLSCRSVPSDPIYETRYPYLDRSLLEFIYSIPREQLVRPGQRRSLMRRSLVGVVPAPILERKRKAFVARSPRLAILAEWDSLADLVQNMNSASLGIIGQQHLLNSLLSARNKEDVPLVRLMRALCGEVWLRSLREYGLELNLDRMPLKGRVARNPLWSSRGRDVAAGQKRELSSTGAQPGKNFS